MKTLTSFLLLLLASISASAGIRPSFSLEGSSWRATDIVVVTEDQQIDGVFKILETWKGDLKPGETITISEMDEFKKKEARLIDSSPWIQREKSSPQYVTCERMVLFLRDAKKIPEDEDEDDNREGGGEKTTSPWRAANPFGDEVKYSTVWIEKGKVYWFVQVINPGPSVLISGGVTDEEMKSKVLHVLNTQTSLNAALAIPDLKTRAEGLEPFAQDSIPWSRDQAFAGLAECGEAALPVLRRMLDNELLIEFRPDVIVTFAKAGGRSVGPELTVLVERELEFWKKTGPTLQVGWWNGKGFDSIEAVEPLRARNGVLLDAINALGAIRYIEAEQVLSEARDFWRALPQLYVGQVSEACDEVLRKFGANRKNGNRPRLPKYEVSFSGNKAFSSTVLREKMAEYVAAYDELKQDPEDEMDSSIFDYAERRLLEFISSQGYLNVQFSTQTGSSERGEMISITIQEGKQYRLGKIRIEGANVFSAEQIRARLTLREGEFADGLAMNKWLYKDLEKAYHDLGYLAVDVESEYEYKAKSADLKVTINEGQQYKVGSIKFKGKTTINTDQLNRAMLLHQGEVFSQKQLDDSIDELNKLGLNLDKDKEVRISQDQTHPLVNIVIFLNKDHRAKESFFR